MKRKIFASLCLMVVTALGGAPAFAQDHTRGSEQGYVVQVTEVHTKDGMFNAYINDLSKVWRKFLDKQKEDGDVVSYGMYNNVNPREGEPDLILTVTFRNWAAFDRGVEYAEELGSQIFGSTEDMREANVDRGELRTIGSTYVLRELKFKD